MLKITEKSLIQQCERSELCFYFEWTVVDYKWSVLASFWKSVACGQTVLPDRSILLEQRLVKNVKNPNATFWVIYKQCGTERLKSCLHSV